MRHCIIVMAALTVGWAGIGCARPRVGPAGSGAAGPGRPATKPVDESILAVGESWDDAVGKLKGSGAVPASALMSLMWLTKEEIADIYLNAPKFPTRRVWILRNGDAVKLWGNDSLGGMGGGLLGQVSRIQQRPTVKDGTIRLVQDSPMLSVLGDDVQRVRLNMPPGVRYTIDDMRPYLTADHNINDVQRAFPLANLYNPGDMFVWLTYNFADGSYLVVGQHGAGSAKLFDASGKVVETFPFGHR